jgi:hypothetical protein
MANLTKELKKLVKQKIDPIHEELFEQFQAAQFHRQMAKFRNEEFFNNNRNKQLVPHIN